MSDMENEAQLIRTERARIREAEAQLEQRTKTLINEAPPDITVRELSTLVGLSPQRVAQMAPGRNPRGRRPKPTNTNTP